MVCDGREVKLESNLVLSKTTAMRLPTGFQMGKVNKSKQR